MRGLADRVALVTGAGGGIGSAIVGRLVECGAVVAGLDHPDGPPLPDRLEASAKADIRDPSAVRDAIEAVLRTTGPIEILVNNAGVTAAEHLGQLDDASWNGELEANLSGHYHAFAAVAPAMRRAGRGVVINVASVNALGHYANPAYSAAKAGLLALTRAIAVEDGRHGLRAVAIAPGTVRTPAWAKRVEARPEILREMARHYPLGRIVEPHEVADLVAFLASDSASAITGCVIPIDCGLTAGNKAMAFQIAGIED